MVSDELVLMIAKLIATALLTGSLYAILGVFIENVLYKSGIARKKIGSMVFFAYFLAFVKVLAFPTSSWALHTLIFLLVSIFYLHRGDLWSTKDHGRWWWKSQENVEY